MNPQMRDLSGCREEDMRCRMNAEPKTVSLSPELKRLQEEWRSLPNDRERERFYFDKFAPLFVPLFAELPIHGAPAELPRPKALISVLGMSFQPVVLMAAWVRPEKMLLLATEKSARHSVDGRGVMDLLEELAGVAPESVEIRVLKAPLETSIYRNTREFMRKGAFGRRDVFLDLTGGKKTMSASAALAGFLYGLPIVYLDYTEYLPNGRTPLAGSEYPRLLENPLTILGDLERRSIFEAFNRGDYAEAARLAERLAERLYDPREAQCLMSLARACADWSSRRFPDALRGMRETLREIEKASWKWAPPVAARLRKNLSALKDLTRGYSSEDFAKKLSLVLWFVAEAETALERGNPEKAVFYAYASVERYVVFCLKADFGLNDKDPDYELVKGKLLLRKEFDEVGELMYGKKYVPLRRYPMRINYGTGVQLLATLSPQRLPREFLRKLLGLAEERNTRIHTASTRKLDEKGIRKYLEIVKKITAPQIPTEDLDETLSAYKLPTISEE